MDAKQSDQKQSPCDRNDFQNIDERYESRKISYPKRIFLILGNEFCERFSFHGLSTILVLYLNEKLGYSEDDATALYHGFVMMIYLLCIPGGIIADVWLGKFKTILCLSTVYVLGCVVVSISAVPTIGISPRIVLITGLVLIAIGSGGIKSSVSSFGGDQFKLPEQAVQLATFFSLFYFSISMGSVISTTISPILRSDVHCFGENDCYALAFGVPAVLMVVAIAFFAVGKPSYTIVKISSENLIVQIVMCISHAIVIKFREGRQSSHKSLLDYSIDKYGEKRVDDVRKLLRLLVLYLTFPIFWTLNLQTGSRWTFQAKQMNGDIGSFIIRPDQMQMLNPFLILFFIPMFETVVYPFLRRLGLRRPLQKMFLGGILTAISFVLAGIVQFKIEATPKNTVHILWQLPQYIILTVGEILFGPVSIGFSYQVAPKGAKAVVLSFWLFNMGLGNLITLVFVSNAHTFKYQSHEFLFFAGLMFVDVLIFGILAYFYKSSVRSEREQPE